MKRGATRRAEGCPAESEPRVIEGVAGSRPASASPRRPGREKRNEDFVAAVFGAELAKPRWEVVAAIADGIGGAKGGRVAAETAVRGFLDGFWDLPETLEVPRAAARIMNALNGWIHSQARQDPSWRAWDALSPRWCCAVASPICCMSATRAPTG